MALNQYQQLAQRTAQHDRPREERTLIAALGLMGEISELAALYAYTGLMPTNYRECVIKEAGDVLWYIAELCSLFDTQLGDLYPRIELSCVPVEQVVLHAVASAGHSAEGVKKHIGHGHVLSVADTLANLEVLLGDLAYILATYGSTLLEACTQNIDKLRVRYPTKFTTEDSIARIDVRHVEQLTLPTSEA